MTLSTGFNSTEAEQLIAMLATLEGTTPPPLTQPPWPEGWTIIYDSQQIGPFDNRWQLASNSQGQYAILIRGTIYAAGSIIDDLLSVMIPANAKIGFELDGTTYSLDYQLAATNNTNAGIHLGFALAMFILMYWPEKGIFWQLIENISLGSDIFIAGHSQGASIATLCRSYLNYLNPDNLFNFGTEYNYKTYVFAQPKPGNDLYGYDYESVASNSGLAFTVNNSQDWVPQVPLTLELPSDINTPNPLSVLLDGSLALTNVTQSVNNLKDNIALAQVSKHMPKMMALRQIFMNQKFQEKVLARQLPEAAHSTTDFKPVLPNLLMTLNFAGCGAAYSLPGVPGTNPCDAKDFFWQHHGAMYYDLLTGTTIPTDCPS